MRTTTSSHEEFGKKLSHHREALGISRLDLANRTRVSQEHIWRLENGFRGCSRDLTIIMGQALDLDVSTTNELLVLAGYRPIGKRGGLQRIG